MQDFNVVMRALCAGAVLALAGATAHAQAQNKTLTISLAGQSMIRGDTRVDAPEMVPVIKGLIRGDIAFTNYEAAVFDAKKGETYKSGRFASPPGSMEALQDFGFHLLSLANNHSFDIKVSGILNTLQTAERLKMGNAGTGRNMTEAAKVSYINTPKGRIAFIALASGLINDGRATATQPGVNELGVREKDGYVSPEDSARILQSVRDARKGADIVIVSQHNHVFPFELEFPSDRPSFTQMLLSQLPPRLGPPEWFRAWTHQLVDAGADVLAMHGPPFLHPVEVYKGKVIFHSLGNFIFQVPPESVHLEEPIMWESVVAYVDFEAGKLKAVRFQPIAMNKVGKGMPNPHDQFDVNQYHRTRGLPKPAVGNQAKYLLERFAQMSAAYGAKMTIKTSADGGSAELVLP